MSKRAGIRNHVPANEKCSFVIKLSHSALAPRCFVRIIINYKTINRNQYMYVESYVRYNINFLEK